MIGAIDSIYNLKQSDIHHQCVGEDQFTRCFLFGAGVWLESPRMRLAESVTSKDGCMRWLIYMTKKLLSGVLLS